MKMLARIAVRSLATRGARPISTSTVARLKVDYTQKPLQTFPFMGSSPTKFSIAYFVFCFTGMVFPYFMVRYSLLMK